MELWIRSQDKEKMLKVDELSLIGMGGHKVGIGTFTKKLKNDDYCNYLGTYKDKKRALEVLDEIQNILIINKQINGSYEECDLATKKMLVESQYKIYEMPKE